VKWLDAQNATYENRDVRADGLIEAELKSIVTALGWEKALNRRSTTWRNLSDAEKNSIDNDEAAVSAIMANPTLMKRPVFMSGSTIIGGFDSKAQESVATLL